MMLKNDIANMALGRLGVSSTVIDVENSNTTEAKIIRRHFRTSLDTMLEKHWWSFARRTAKLTKHSDDPEQGYEYAYHFPINAAEIRQIAPEGRFYHRLELYPDMIPQFEEMHVGGLQLIYTNVEDAHAEYTERLAENSSFKTYFGRGLAAQLSLDIGPSLITNNWPKIRNAINESAHNEISSAIADDIARSPQKMPAESPLVRARWQ